MGQTLRRNVDRGGRGRRSASHRLNRWRTAVAVAVSMVLLLGAGVPLAAQVSSTTSAIGGRTSNYGLTDGVRLVSGRFTVVAERRDARLAQGLLDAAQSRDSFPGLPRPRAAVLIAVAPDEQRFREWVGSGAPEWGAAIAFPADQRIIMQGSGAGAMAGNPLVVLRHELAHLALREAMGPLPPRWFDEGYASVAAGEWNREQSLETSMTLVWRSLPTREQLEDGFAGGASEAQFTYAVAHRAVAELADIDRNNGLRNFFRHWKETGSFEAALRLSYGLTGVQFDRYWHGRTKQRYGALAVVANLSLIAGVFGLLLGPLFWMRRKRDRRRLEAMRAADAAQDRAWRESALAALLGAEADFQPAEVPGEGEGAGTVSGTDNGESGPNPCSEAGGTDILPA